MSKPNNFFQTVICEEYIMQLLIYLLFDYHHVTRNISLIQLENIQLYIIVSLNRV